MKSSDGLFFGRTTDYWLMLQEKAEKLNVTHLLEEIATLRSKVSFYESRIKEMSHFSGMYLEVKK